MFELLLALAGLAIIIATVADARRRVNNAKGEVTELERELTREFEMRRTAEDAARKLRLEARENRDLAQAYRQHSVAAWERADDLEATHPIHMVRDMLEAFEQPINTSPQLELDGETVGLRLSLLSEEFAEHLAAVKANDMVELADSIADMIVVLIGTAFAYGIPLQAVLEEVHRSNMTKVNPETGRVEKREDGKVIKPVTFEEPRLARLLGLEEVETFDGDVVDSEPEPEDDTEGETSEGASEEELRAAANAWWMAA